MADETRWLGKSWRESPMIAAAMEQRPPSEIGVVTCDRCGSATYYNEGSHCTCEHCEADLDHLIGEDAEIMTLEDIWMADEDFG